MKASSVTLQAGLSMVLVMSAAVWVSAADQVELQFALRPAIGDTMNKQAFAQKVIGLFEQRHPNVTVTYVPLVGDWQDKLTAEMVAGSAPDLFEMWGSFANDWGDRGLLLDLNPFVKQDFNQDEIRDFYPGQWASTIQVGGPHAGERIGLPLYVNDGVTYYNADAFAAAGLSNPGELEQTHQWDTVAFRQAAKKLTLRDAAGQVSQWGFSGSHWDEWVYDFGGKAFDWPERPLTFTLDQPKAIEGLEFIRDLIWEDESMIHSGDFIDGHEAMADQAGSSRVGDTFTRVGKTFAWNIAPLPVSPDGVRHSWIGKDMYGIFGGTRHPKEAWELLKFLVSPEVQVLMTQLTGQQPARISAMRAYLAAYPGIAVNYAAEMGQVAIPAPSYVIPQSAKIDALLTQVVNDSVWNQKESIKSAIEEVKPAILNLLGTQ